MRARVTLPGDWSFATRGNESDKATPMRHTLRMPITTIVNISRPAFCLLYHQPWKGRTILPFRMPTMSESVLPQSVEPENERSTFV